MLAWVTPGKVARQHYDEVRKSWLMSLLARLLDTAALGTGQKVLA